MSCREHDAVVDYARGVRLEPGRLVALERHLEACLRCTALLGRERALSADLQRLAAESSAQAAPHVEEAVLRAFDEAWLAAEAGESRWLGSVARGRRMHARLYQLGTVAALIALACGIEIGRAHV